MINDRGVRMSSILDAVKVHESWNKFLTTDIRHKLDIIESQIGTDYTPDTDKVLRFMQLDISKLKVVILGQDPYKPAGVANGRAFQPANLTSWNQKFRQVSLKNIVRNIYKSKLDIRLYDLIPTYNEIIASGFEIKPPLEWFDSIESQGVLLLNTSLTCKIGESNSHREIWKDFSDECIRYLAKTNNDLYWFLWGKEACSYSSLVMSWSYPDRIYQSKHPMMCSKSYTDDFLKSKCFKDTMKIINWMG